jgi:integrase
VELGRIFWLRTDKANAKGFCPVSLRLTIRGYTKAEVSTGVHCRPEDWAGPAGKDGPLKKSHPEYAADSDSLENTRRNAKIAKQRLEALGQPVTPQAIAILLKNPKALQPGPPACLLEFMEAELESHYRAGNRATFESQRRFVRKLRAWHGPKPLPLSAFPPKQALKFYQSLLSAKQRGGEIASANSTIAHLVGIFRRGIKQALWSEAQNPFACIDKAKALKRQKVRLTQAELLRVVDLELEAAPWLWLARAAYLVQFYLRGERIGACLLLRWPAVQQQDTCIRYQAQKGGPFKEVPVVEELSELLAAFAPRRTQGRTFVLPYLPDKYDKLDAKGQLQEVKKATSLINKHLKTIAHLADIDKPLRTHAARHTFATIGRRVAGVTAVQQFLGHTTELMTQTYLADFESEELSDAAAAIYASLRRPAA